MNYSGDFLKIRIQCSTGMVDIIFTLPMSGTNVRWMRRVPVDTPLVVTFIRKSVYTLKFIIHPNGGNAMQIVCDSCGAAYPFNWQMMKFYPCAMCAVHRESGVRVSIPGLKWKCEKVWSV
jgi:hypothetical protein